MRALLLLPLALAACRSTPPPLGDPAHVTFYGDHPRLEEWRAVVVEGMHVHAAIPGPCLSEEIKRLGFDDPKSRAPKNGLSSGCMAALLGPAHGGAKRLVVLLIPPGDGEPAEALVVDVPRLAPEEVEKTFEPPLIALELERPAGTRKASIDRGRVTVRRAGGGRYDVELFATLKPGGEQVLARVRPLVD
jgi:hypothetical protein